MYWDICKIVSQNRDKGNSEKEIMALIFEPNVENWPGYPPMSPMPHIDKAEVKKIAKWIKSLE